MCVNTMINLNGPVGIKRLPVENRVFALMHDKTYAYVLFTTETLLSNIMRIEYLTIAI